MERLGWTIVVTDRKAGDLPVETYYYRTEEAVDFMVSEITQNYDFEAWVYYVGIEH